jgi:hypothetical protein
MANRVNLDKLFARIRGLVKDGFADPDFGPREVAAPSASDLGRSIHVFIAINDAATFQ